MLFVHRPAIHFQWVGRGGSERDRKPNLVRISHPVSSRPFISRRALFATTVLLAALALCSGMFFRWHHAPVGSKPPSPVAKEMQVDGPVSGAGEESRPGAAKDAVDSPVTADAGARVSPDTGISREMDPRVNPYAAGLHGPGKSKRAWDAAYIQSFQGARAGDAVRFELTRGVFAAGEVKMVLSDERGVSHVSGTLTEPEKGKFFLLAPPEGGKAGKAVGVMEFPAGDTAYRVEPTGVDGEPELWERELHEVVCMGMEEADPGLLAKEAAEAEKRDAEEIVPLRPDEVPDYIPSYNAGIVSLQSYPGAQAVILLDFAGGYTPHWGGVNYARPDVSNDTIKDIWKRIAEDYMPFNINVTTDIKVFQAAPANSRQRCCYTTTPVTPAGVAYFGSWNWGNDAVCWSVYNVGKAAAEVGAHEVGHTLGLAHQGLTTTPGGGYYGGHGGGETGWAPVMGVGYYQPVTTWAKGEYQNANEPQDELQTITTTNNNVGYRIDDTGGTLATSRYLDIFNDNKVFGEGVIERTSDTDALQFTTTGGAVSLTVDPVAPNDWGNLATMATLADATDAVIATNNVQNDVSSTITATLAAGTYTFRVTGTGKGNPLTDGFSSYGSLGYYSISGSVAGARLPTRLSVDERVPNNTVVGTVPATNPNSSPLVYTITGGNTGTTFSVDNTGVVRVANNSLLDYHALAANPALYAAQFELFMNITNVNNPSFSETKRRVVISVAQVYAPTPAALTASLDSCLRVNLEWSETYGTVSYNVKRSTTQGGPYTTVANTTAGKFTDSGLAHGVTYYYVVTAVNANGESNTSPEAKVLALAVAGGFESPVLGGGHRYNPTGGGGGWTFNGESGIISNGSGFNAPNAPEGVQAAFVQRTGSIQQTFSGFTPGTAYTISYLAAQRGGNNQTWSVVIDGNVIKTNSAGPNSYGTQTATFTATAVYHTLSFVGTNLNGGDNTIFIDDVKIFTATPSIPNFSFETPAIGGNYQYNPSGASWTFTGSAGNGSGVAGNGSGFGAPNAPNGTQVAFVQNLGTITRSLTGFVPGKSYTLGYFAAQRGGMYGGQTWNVKIDSNVIQTNGVGSTSFTYFQTNFTATSSTHVLQFAGTNLNGGDRTVFIDNVSLSLPTEPVAPMVALSSPANNTAFGINAPVNLTAAVTANGNLIQGVQYFVDNALIGQISSAPYTCAWGNVTGGKHSAYARVLFNNGSFADSPLANFMVANANLNLGFEAPGIGSGNYNYRTSGAAWAFSGTGASGSGIVANGSGFNNPNAPEGSQAAFLQQYGSFAQTIAGFTPGTSYTINYSAAQRGTVQNGGESWNVVIDGTVIKSNAPGGTSYTAQTATFTATAGFHTIAFVGTNLNGGDNTVFIDNLSFNPPLVTSQGPKLVANTSPATAVDVVASDVSFVAAFSSNLPVSYQWQKIVNGQVFDIPGATTATLNLPNLQLSDTGAYRLQATNSAGVAVSSVSPLTVNSLPAAVNNVIAACAAQTGLGAAIADFSPSWTLRPGSLISTKTPASVGSGSFTQSTNVLTDGSAGRLIYAANGASATQVTAGGDRGQSVTYSLGAAAGGYDLSSIVVHGGWCDAGRDQQAYTVSYSTVAAPATFVQLAVVEYNPSNSSGVQSATRSTLTSATNVPLASGVVSLKFDFTTPAPENGYCGYSEIAVFGAPLTPAVTMQTSPATARDVVGGQVTFTASIAGAAPLTYQWQKVVGGVSSDIVGAQGQTLTLTNLQTGDSAGYRLKGTNAQGSVTTTAATLTVSNVPAAVNNVITSMAAQTGLGGNSTFLPSWKLAADNSLIGGMVPSSSAGNFNLNSNGKGLIGLTTPRTLAISPTGGGDNSINYLTGGNASGAGSSVVYTLPTSATGHTLTKIIVHGGWSDAGRDQQAYTVSYSKVATPTTFVTLGAVNNNPSNPGSVQSTTRATLTAANGMLATNVAAVKFDFTTPGPENGWVGYSQLAVYGAPTLSAPINLMAEAGNGEATLSWTATGAATSYNVKRSTVSGGSYTTVGSVTNPGFLDTGLTNGTTYYYVVTALNAGGETGVSAQVGATPIAPGYLGWLDDYPSLTGADRAPDADPDKDGLPNGIEFLTGTSPVNGGGSSPVVTSVDGSGNLVLKFKRVDAAKEFPVVVEVFTDLPGAMTTVAVPAGPLAGPPVTVVENGISADDVTVVIPANGDPKKFARVRISIPFGP